MQTLQPIEQRVSRPGADRHYLMRMAPYRTADNKVDGALLTFVDVSSVVHAEEMGQVLADELKQQVHDVLALAAELATRTMREAPIPEAFATLYLRRANALSQACALIEHDTWGQPGLREVMRGQLAPHTKDGMGRVSLEGPAILLRPRGVLAIGIVVHELARQSVESGALSVPSGRVSIRWQVEEITGGATLSWSWIENGVPANSEPLDATLVELGIEHTAQGSARIEAEPGSRRVTLTMKLDAIGARSAEAAG
jgi:two-component system CheB/CheR fusion protein